MKGFKTKLFLILIIICSVSFSFCWDGSKKRKISEEGQGIILNLPADALVNCPKWGANIDSITGEQVIAALDEYINQYANTQVTKLFYNVNYLRACYESKVMTPFWDVPDPSTNMTDWPRKYWQINKKGIDLFKVCIEKSRINNISPWLSFRMNDHHYRDDAFRLNKLMTEHPELRLSPSGSFDYAKKEVREYYKAFITEALNRYDVDGIELDWMRTYELFKPGEEKRGIEIINSFMEDIREITNLISKERGRKIQIAARIPATPSIGRTYGLDAIAWVKNSSVDIIIPTNFWYPTNFNIPIDQWKDEIGNFNSCIIAPGADLAFRCITDGNSIVMHNSIETMRALSTNAYTRGAGAVYLFNHFDWVIDKRVFNMDGSSYVINDKPVIIKEGGTFETVTGKPRIHVLTFTTPDSSQAKASLPKRINKKAPAKFQIYTGPKPAKDKYIIRLGLDEIAGYKNAHLKVSVNNSLAKQIQDLPKDTSFLPDMTNKIHVAKNVTEIAARVMQFEAVPEIIKSGYNTIEVELMNEFEQNLIWIEVYIH